MHPNKNYAVHLDRQMLRRKHFPGILVKTYSVDSIDDRGRSIRLLGILEPGLLTHQRPQLVQVYGGAIGCIPLQVVMSHTHLTEVARMAEGNTQ